MTDDSTHPDFECYCGSPDPGTDGICRSCNGACYRIDPDNSPTPPDALRDCGEPLIHEMRTYAAHLPSCRYVPAYPDDPQRDDYAPCSCGFDAVLDRYATDILAAQGPTGVPLAPCGPEDGLRPLLSRWAAAHDAINADGLDDEDTTAIIEEMDSASDALRSTPAAPRAEPDCAHQWEPMTGIACFRCNGVQFVRATHRAEAASPRRDPGADWPAVERLVDAAIRRGEITASRGAEILGLRLATWRDRALEIAAEDAAPTPEAES